MAIGGVRLVVTKYASPCYKIRGSFSDADEARIAQTTHPGWSRVCARVVSEGLIRVGDAAELLAAR
jgi:MOSC domain-containing protein YiiM